MSGVRLEAIRIGGSTYTSLEALQRFANHLGASGPEQMTPEPTPARTRQKQIDQASKRLREALGMKEPDQAMFAASAPSASPGKAVPHP